MLGTPLTCPAASGLMAPSSPRATWTPAVFDLLAETTPRTVNFGGKRYSSQSAVRDTRLTSIHRDRRQEEMWSKPN